ncbi:MAG: Uncharacterized protein FD143_3167 [Ignavibacteria bacterium]|nr:MAG: Uncharacterized protein FD143_3167 [Ignavibacteria bacterium]
MFFKFHLLDVKQSVIPAAASESTPGTAAGESDGAERAESDASDADLIASAEQLELAEQRAKGAAAGDAGGVLGCTERAANKGAAEHASAANGSNGAADAADADRAGGAGSATLCSIIAGTTSSSSTVEPVSSADTESDIEIDEAPIRPSSLKLQQYAYKPKKKSPVAPAKPRRPSLKRQLAIDGGTATGPLNCATAELIWSNNKPPLLIAKPARAQGQQYGSATFAISSADLAAATAAKFGGSKRGRKGEQAAALH